MVNFQRKQRYGWEDLLTIMHLLRAPEGCPWDREQTHQSIRRNFLEETYEALDAIDRNDIPGMCEELGDVLLQVVFHSVMEEEQGRFTADDVVDGVAQKLVFRHTHVFGAAEAADSAQALEGWEAQKKKEKGFTSPADAVEAVPHTLPALWRAEKIGLHLLIRTIRIFQIIISRVLESTDVIEGVVTDPVSVFNHHPENIRILPYIVAYHKESGFDLILI